MPEKEDQAPVWARPDAFPKKPEGSSVTGAFCLYGFIDDKGKQVSAETGAELCDKVGESKNGLDLVWTPESDYLVAPEEVTELRPKLWQRRSKWAKDDLADGKRLGLIFGIVMLWYVFSAYSQSGNLESVLRNQNVGISGILLLIFGLVPLYEGWKILRKGKPKSEQDWQSEVAESRFDSWLSKQKAPVTMGLLVVMLIAGLAQVFLERGMDWSAQSVSKAGLLKNPAGTIGGEWWRYLTAPMLHGNLVHWLMNAAALRYLARRVECLARWPHVLLVMVFSAIVGGICTAKFMPLPSVGASGGIMGLLGFLLVFEVMHSKLVPKPTRRRLIAGVAMTVLMGIFGFQFIDNAAHAGGLVAGMVYAAAIFPPSKSPHRPRIMKQDKLLAAATAVGIAAVLVLVLVKLLG